MVRGSGDFSAPPTGSRQSHAAHVAKKCRRRSAADRSPASPAVRAASTDQARPGRPPNGAESRPRALAHALTCLASRAKAGPWAPTEASTASASLTALSAIAAASPNSARRSTASAGSSDPVATTARSTSSPPSRNRRPGTRAPTTSRTSPASRVASLNLTRTVVQFDRAGQCRHQVQVGAGQRTAHAPGADDVHDAGRERGRDEAGDPVGDGARAGAAVSPPSRAASSRQRTSPVPRLTVPRTRIGSSPRRDSSASSPTLADMGASRAAQAAARLFGSVARPRLRCGVKPS